MKNCNRSILCFLIGGILFSGITVAAMTITAKEVSYTPSNLNFKVNNSDDALNYLYKLTDYEVPKDTYFYDKTTKGLDIKRYKKVDNKFYACDEHGKIISNSNSNVNISNLVEYKGSSSENLSAGTAGYANKNFVLGNGNDNLTFSGNGTKKNFVYLGTTNTYDLSSFENYKNFTSDNFIVNAIRVHSNSTYINTNGWCSQHKDDWPYVTINVTKNYDPKTGKLVIGGTRADSYINLEDDVHYLYAYANGSVDYEVYLIY